MVVENYATASTAASVASVTTMASAMLFGTITFTTAALATRAYMLGDKRLFDVASNPRSSALDIKSLASVYTLLFHFTVFGLILLYAYICENHPPYPHADKNYDADIFFFLTALLFVVSAFTWKKHDKSLVHGSSSNNKNSVSPKSLTKKNTSDVEMTAPSSSLGDDDDDDGTLSKHPMRGGDPPPDNHMNGSGRRGGAFSRIGRNGQGGSSLFSLCCSSSSPSSAGNNGEVRPVAEPNDKIEVLNRDQTEEWKGWMQFMFLLYHYYHAEEVYNAIRIMITCYVWMTGFGNFSFFYLKADYGAVRVVQMLWRLNFLVLFLCLTQGTTYILYYICLLHTYFFFMVYVTMRIGCKQNYTKWWIRIKLAVLAVVIFLVWDCDFGLFKLLHYPFFGETPMMGAGAGAMWEWYFRSTLDHWSTYLGMIFALNFPITSLWYRKLEAQSTVREVLAKGIVGLALFGLFAWWVAGPFMLGKFAYNQTNSYYGWIPLVTYIYFRNLTPWLRNHTLELLHQIGKTTLETYLMQHHIWLTSDAKSLLTLVPGWPKINFLLVSLIYVYLSRRLYQLTLFLRGMVLPDNKTACIRNLMGMGGIIGSFCTLAYLLHSQGFLNLGIVGIISVVCGYILYSFLVGFAAGPSDSAVEGAHHTTSKPGTNPMTLVTSCLIGVVAVLACGVSWHHMAVTGAARIQSLPESCDAFVNQGRWVATHGCDEGPRGEAYRDFGVAPVSTCSAQNTAYVWGWQEEAPSTHCRFKQRDVKSLKKHLKLRNVYFAGDSITRYLYHSFCRQLGIADAGAYNATEGKHHDISRQAGDINLDFIWAAYSAEVVDAVQNVTSFINTSTAKKPDLLVLGGGAWDRLWMTSTDEEKENLRKTVSTLASKIAELKKLGVPVVWLTPTTINTAALPSVEKQTNINEEEMVKVRALYKELGVLSASSFVIDGPSFTSSRVAESYDGVHYPHQVYSAGAQILCNAVDWLLPVPHEGPLKPTPQPGAMSHRLLGFMMLCIAALGLFTFDGFTGFSYLAAIFVPGVAPKRLYYEAFSSLHQKMKLPPLDAENMPGSPTLSLVSSRSLSPQQVERRMSSFDQSGDAPADGDQEIVSLLNKER
jgi:N-acetylneuraminate 9-O-acetyltransferase